MYLLMEGCMHGWMDGWVDGWMDGWMCMWCNIRMCEYMYVCNVM